MTARPLSPPADSPAQAHRPRGSVMWVQGLACGALLTFAAPTALLLIILFAPAAVCALAETTARSGLTRAVALGCAAASLGPVWRLWMQDDRMDQALATLSNPTTVALAWGAGACAWALCQILPVILARAWDAREAGRTRAIQAEIDDHLKTWTLDSE